MEAASFSNECIQKCVWINLKIRVSHVVFMLQLLGKHVPLSNGQQVGNGSKE